MELNLFTDTPRVLSLFRASAARSAWYPLLYRVFPRSCTTLTVNYRHCVLPWPCTILIVCYLDRVLPWSCTILTGSLYTQYYGLFTNLLSGKPILSDCSQLHHLYTFKKQTWYTRFQFFIVNKLLSALWVFPGTRSRFGQCLGII